MRKQRTMVYSRGVYVNVAELRKALGERGLHVDEDELDAYVRTLGGQRVHRGRWLARVVPTRHLPRPAQYYLPELAFQRVRQRR